MKTGQPKPLERVRAQSRLLNLFSDYLPLSLHVVEPGDNSLWYALVPPPEGLHPVQFEIYFKKVNARYQFHRRLFAKTLKMGQAQEASHHGVWDCAAPGPEICVVAGAYRANESSLSELEAQYRGLSGKTAQGELWLSYLRSFLDQPLLNAASRKLLRQACQLASDWMLNGKGASDVEIEALKPGLARECSPRMEHFSAARRERIWWWASQAKGLASWDRRDFGLKQMPGAVLAIGVARHGQDWNEGRELLLSARLRDLSFRLAVERGWVAGRGLGDGACLLLPPPGRGAEGARLLMLEARAARDELSRRLGAPLQLGISQSLDGERLPEAFRQAEWALLMAQPKGEALLAFQAGAWSGDDATAVFDAGRVLWVATLAGQAREAKAACEAALGAAARLYPGRADLLKPQLTQWMLELYQGVQQRGLLEGPLWESARRDALTALALARGARDLAAAFAQEGERLALLASQPRSGASRMRLAQARRRFEEQPAPKLGLAARSAGLSASRFSRLFKAEAGEGFGAYRRRQKLEKASELLRQSPLPIWRVAQECGYASASHFSQVFQAEFKFSPKSYRLQHSNLTT